jgi:GNAT superfamily N-acetyltransferase
MIRIQERLPTPDEYCSLRSTVGWALPKVGECERALLSSQASVCGFYDDDLAGMARLVGDGTFYLFIVDVVVDPAYQGRGVGRGMITAPGRMAGRTLAVPAINLVAGPDVFEYYEHLGFDRTESFVMSKRL